MFALGTNYGWHCTDKNFTILKLYWDRFITHYSDLNGCGVWFGGNLYVILWWTSVAIPSYASLPEFSGRSLMLGIHRLFFEFRSSSWISIFYLLFCFINIASSRILLKMALQFQNIIRTSPILAEWDSLKIYVTELITKSLVSCVYVPAVFNWG